MNYAEQPTVTKPFTEFNGDYYVVIKRDDSTVYAVRPPPDYLRDGGHLSTSALKTAESISQKVLGDYQRLPAIALFFLPSTAAEVQGQDQYGRRKTVIEVIYSPLNPGELRDLEQNIPVLKPIGTFSGIEFIWQWF